MPRTGAELRAFVKQRGGEVSDVMRVHRTQTNGLCLLLDRFQYEFESERGSTALGDASSPVCLRCTVEGPIPLPAAAPDVVWRRGLDLHPIDVHDDEAVRWLRACVGPDHPERRRRLDGAIALARPAPSVVRAGDLVDDLAALLAEVPVEAQLVVFHSAVLSYVSPDRRQAFAGVLAEASARRDVVWVSNEGPGVVPEVTALAPPLGELRFLLGRTRFTRGRRRDELLALAHPHGADLTWL